jgi:hypothetical protein
MSSIAPNDYEAAAFEALNGRVRSGDSAVSGSRRSRPFEGCLFPAPHVEQRAEKKQTRLAVTENADASLAAKQYEITRKLKALQESIGKVEGSLCLDEKGKPCLPALEREIPALVERLRPHEASSCCPADGCGVLFRLDDPLSSSGPRV